MKENVFKWKNLFVKCKILTIVILIIISLTGPQIIYSAIVSDNDGSAFVTKAEFDNLKNTFAEQIVNYNNSITDKIDGAIAAYLAGLRLKTEQILDNSKSILSYPLTIYNDDDTYSLNKWNAQTKDSGIFWKPSFKFYGIYCWTHFMDIYKISVDMYPINSIKSFYNLTNVDTVNNIAIIDGLLDEYKYNISFNQLLWIRGTWGGSYNYGCIFRLDQLRSTYASNATTVTIPTTGDSALIADGSELYSTSGEFRRRAISYFFNNTMTFEFSTPEGQPEDNFNSFYRTSGAGTLYALNEPTAEIYDDWGDNTSELEFTKKNILDKLCTGAKTDVLFPVAYNNSVYFTNVRRLRNLSHLYSTYSKEVKQYYNSALWTGTPQLGAFIDAGWSVEPETQPINSEHKWYNQSLIKGEHLKYYVTVPNKQVRYEQSIFDGILLSDLPNQDMDSVRIQLNISQENTTNKKYLIVSKSPISQCDPNSLDDTNLLYLYNTKDCTSGTGTKMYELDDGLNNIYFDDALSNDNIYIKIIWNNSDTTYTKIVEEPIISIFK